MNPTKRSLAMLALFKQGSTLQAIGDRFDLTRERVRQILRATFNIKGCDGGRAERSRQRLERWLHEQDKICLKKWGCTVEQRGYITSRLRQAWREQSRTARCRGIEFKLTLFEFWQIWDQSGKLAERGRGADKFCMSRLHDRGAYEVGNVRIITNAENSRLYQLASPSSKKRRPQELQGVFLAYPGFSKPYLAKYKNEYLGLYATEAEAYEARKRRVLEAA